MKKFVIAKEGVLWAGIPIIIGISFLFLEWIILAAIAFTAGIFCLWFFRQPCRKPEKIDEGIYAPADGKIIRICEEYEDTFFKAAVNKISIFMNVFNVHVTYAPACGTVSYQQYTPGSFINAGVINDKEANENNFIGIDNRKSRIALRQVAGYIARRIVSDVKVGDKVSSGKRMGLIKFGSRIDVYLPKEWKIGVSVGERTRAGYTVLAK